MASVIHGHFATLVVFGSIFLLASSMASLKFFQSLFTEPSFASYPSVSYLFLTLILYNVHIFKGNRRFFRHQIFRHRIFRIRFSDTNFSDNYIFRPSHFPTDEFSEKLIYILNQYSASDWKSSTKNEWAYCIIFCFVIFRQKNYYMPLWK